LAVPFAFVTERDALFVAPLTGAFLGLATTTVPSVADHTLYVAIHTE
jgi:hypothetical protein